MIEQEILIEIDSTLDQLICNAQAIENIHLSELSEIELSAFQNTQESLLNHLLHMDKLLEEKRKNQKTTKCAMKEKREKFTKLNSSYQKKISHAQAKSDILSKRRSKKYFQSRLKERRASSISFF